MRCAYTCFAQLFSLQSKQLPHLILFSLPTHGTMAQPANFGSFSENLEARGRDRVDAHR
jgi:hypothetical protein